MANKNQVLLKRLQVTGFKSIESMDVALRPINVLIGANGSGKTNFISVFKLLNRLAEENLENYIAKNNGASFFLHFGRKKTEKITIRLEFTVNADENAYEIELEANNNGRFLISSEKGFFQRDGSLKAHEFHMESRFQAESGLRRKSQSSPTAQYLLKNLENLKVYHFHDTGETAKIKEEGATTDNRQLKSDGSNLAAFLYRLKIHYYDYYSNIKKTIQQVAPFFDDFILEPLPENPNSIRLKWREKNGESEFTAHSLSDGTLRFMCLATLLLQPDELLPATIIIDEPELGLHPYAINLLADMFKGVVHNSQVVISTQSVLLLDEFDLEDVIIVDLVKGHSEFKKLSSEDLQDWLEDYSLGELWQKNLLGGRPR